MPRISLDGRWDFIADPPGAYAVDHLPAGVPISVPGCWEAQLPERIGIVCGWYRRRIVVPPSWAEQSVVLLFEAVMYSAEVWLDGRPLGRHEGGYSPFEVELTPAVRAGQEQTLIVQVANPLNALHEFPSRPMEEVLYAKDRMSRLPLSEASHGKQTWYGSMSGIWKSVSLEAVPEVAFKSVRVDPDLHDGSLTVRWSLSRPAGAARLELRVVDDTGREAARSISPVPAGAQVGTELIHIPGAKTWSPESPSLYRLEARVVDRSGSSHEREVRFGLRRIEAREGRLFLNGRPLLLRGALDQDLFPEGLAFTGDASAVYRAQFRRAKEMGLNLIRCHIKVPDGAYLDAADEAGVLLWCELPNWTQFSSRAAIEGKATLQSMVETMGHHPSIVIWTIINEDWGTRLREEARDRRWLLSMYDWLKALDPSRLVVDNSACDSSIGKPNFHLATDIADFHEYFSFPDKAIRWRNFVADFARRPPWLWSPHGDARPRGDEPLVISEFGNWGLPDITHYEESPWWFATGRQLYQPEGALDRFRHFGLQRVWPDWRTMAEATQERQFEALQFQVGELRRHASLSGYVITEFTDAYWEANGLLDIDRAPKRYYARLMEINGPEMLIADLARRDCWGGEPMTIRLAASSFDRGEPPRRLRWVLTVDGSAVGSGERAIDLWPVDGAADLGELRVELPAVATATPAVLELQALDATGAVRVSGSWSLAILPAARQQTAVPRRVAVDDPLAIWQLDDRIRRLGHQPASLDQAEVLLTSELTVAGRHFAEQGGHVIVLIRSRTALPPEVELEREIVIHPRWLADDSATDPRNPWRGDWISAFSWILPGHYLDLPPCNPLDFAYQEVIPDHVLRGYHPQLHADEVTAGMFVGWVHAPAALLWTFPQGQGSITVTTFKLAPEDGPIATVLLEDLLQGQDGTGLSPRPTAAIRQTVGDERLV